MKLKTILILLLLTGGVSTVFPQETVRDRIERRRQSETSSIATNIRAGQTNRHQEEGIEHAKWSRVIYRYLGLSKEANSPLYYPVTPTEGRMSLFTMIFRLLQDNRIQAYEYLDGREEFSEEYLINFQEFLDRFGIFYETTDGKIVVDDADIPGNEVQGYFVKEIYYFDTGTSNFVITPLALCPVIHRQGDYETTDTRYPLFWIPYDEIAPYAQRLPVMASGLNNSINGTVDDFFRTRKYDGEIYKTGNPRNLAISQYTSSPEEMKAEQEKIEQELIDFEKTLWKKEEYSPQPDQRVSRRGRGRAANVSSGSTQTMRDRRY